MPKYRVTETWTEHRECKASKVFEAPNEDGARTMAMREFAVTVDWSSSKNAYITTETPREHAMFEKLGWTVAKDEDIRAESDGIDVECLDNAAFIGADRIDTRPEPPESDVSEDEKTDIRQFFPGALPD